VDIGSNNQEFWYWIPRGDKHQFFCSYDALEQNKVKFMPFPFQPEWVMEAMGMGRYGPPEKYELAVEPEQLKLIERTRSPQGARVKKIIVFRRRESKNADQPQVTDFLLVDEATNKTLCSAHITRRHKIEHREAGTIVEIPREMELRWPAQQLKLVLQLNKVQLANQFPETVFRRTPIQGYPAFDLATGPAEPVHRAGGPGGLEPDR
jgi:hypothetical protein